ncbi:MAG TPA: DNA methyltransferase, partial [Deinococcales bacterium]|nr:DNA methyltransferase [Deinococcales bacterium]
FDPFTGIGSTGFQALRTGRRFVGVELKPAYFEHACRNLTAAVEDSGAPLFDGLEEERAS